MVVRKPLLSTWAYEKLSPLSKQEEIKDVSFNQTLLFCHPYILPRTRRLQCIGALSVLCTLAYKACLLVPGVAMKTVVDALSSNDPVTRRHVPVLGALAFFLGKMFAVLFAQGQDVSFEYCSQEMSRQFAKDSFEHLLNLSLSYHNKVKTGETISILGRAIGSISKLMRIVIFSLGPTIIEAAVVSAIFFRLGSPAIALCTTLTVILYILYTGCITKWRARIGRELREVENKASARVTESVLNFSTVKSFGMERAEVCRYNALRAAVRDAALKSKGIYSVSTTGQNLIVQLGTFLGLILAARKAARSEMTPGDLIMVHAYIGQLFGPLIWLGNSYGETIAALTNVEQVMELFGTRPDILDSPHATPLLSSRASVSFDHVSFTYDRGAGGMGGVHDVSLCVPEGKMVALVGASGAGKSTLARLLLRLYDTDRGAVRVDGRDVRTLTQESLRRRIGLVAQETILFNDTLGVNIRYGAPEATEEDVWAAVRAANLDGFVRRQALGLDTVVGERGVRLSGGERQRVGIARAVIKKPAVVVLDEATSALSSVDEREIWRSLRGAVGGRTTVAIAHRLSTVRGADEILVMEGGRVVERGGHGELLRKKGVYAEMWELQAG